MSRLGGETGDWSEDQDLLGQQSVSAQCPVGPVSAICNM